MFQQTEAPSLLPPLRMLLPAPLPSPLHLSCVLATAPQEHYNGKLIYGDPAASPGAPQDRMVKLEVEFHSLKPSHKPTSPGSREDMGPIPVSAFTMTIPPVHLNLHTPTWVHTPRQTPSHNPKLLSEISPQSLQLSTAFRKADPSQTAGRARRKPQAPRAAGSGNGEENKTFLVCSPRAPTA